MNVNKTKRFSLLGYIESCKDYWNDNWERFGKTLAYKTPFVDWKTDHITVTGSGLQNCWDILKIKNTL